MTLDHGPAQGVLSTSTADAAERSSRRHRAPRPARLLPAAITVGMLALAVRASVLRDAYFITDDYMLSSRAMENDLTFDYLTRVHTGHFEPIGFAVMWLLAHFAPLSWGWAATFLLAGQVLLSVLVWQLLVELFGHRYRILVPFTMFCFSPLTLAAFTWLSAGIIWLPLMISMAGMLRFHVRYIRSGRDRDAVISFAWFLVGLAAFEKILIFLPFLVAFTVALELSFGRRLRDVRDLVLRQWRIWTGYAVLTILYLGLYVRGSRASGASVGLEIPKASDLGDFIVQTLGRTFVPGLMGGPWDWARQSYGLAVVDSPRFFDWLAWSVFIAFIAGSILLRRYAGAYWASLVIYLGASMAIIAVGRVAYLGPVFALETRYLADAVIPAVVVVGACMMPLVGERDHLTPEGHRWTPQLKPRTVPALVLPILVIVVLSLNAIARYATYSSDNPTRAFVANVRESLEELPADAEIVDTWLPDNVLSPFFGEYNRASRFLAPLVDADTRAVLYERDSYTRPYVLAVDGRIVPMVVSTYATADPPGGVCRVQSGGRVQVPLTAEMYPWDWIVRIGYLSESDFTATVSFGGRSTEVPITRGLGGVYLTLPGDGRQLEITEIPPLANFCVGDVQVGTATAQP